MSKQEMTTKCFKIPKSLWDSAIELINSGEYISESELIRDAIRLLLKSKGIR